MTAHETSTAGALYLVATPIGNLNDITLRALATLKEVDLILAEDTRQAWKLLNAYQIKNKVEAFHAHNEQQKTESILKKLSLGQNIALISDAGTPLISDPGFPLVRAAIDGQYQVIPIPGACALISALSASGVPTDCFTFVGFLPAKGEAREHKLQQLSKIPHTIIFYESTHRIVDSIEAIQKIFGSDFSFVLAKELTKTHETIISNSCENILNWLKADDNHVKGEFVLILPPREVASDFDETIILKQLLAEIPLKKAVEIAHNLTKINKNKLYKTALELKETQ